VHQAPPPPSRRARLWVPLVLACLTAVVALVAAIGGVLPVPGMDDASSSTDAATSAGAASAPPAASSGAASSSTVVAPSETPAPATLPEQAAPPSAEPPADTAAETPLDTAAETPVDTASETEVAPAPAPAAAPPVAAAAPAAPGPEGQVLALVNAERAAAGCGALSADPGLAGVARAHSADMRDRGYFSHVDLDGLDPYARARAAGIGYARAENIARGQADADAVMAAWMASPGHRQNILDCSLTSLGVGVATGAGGPWWTQLFGG